MIKDRIVDDALAAFQTESESIRETANAIDRADFLRAAELLVKAPRIASTGCGHSGIAARHFAHLMCCCDRPARFLSPAEAVHGGLGFLEKGDVLLWTSRGGKTDELIPIVSVSRKKGVTVIGVTENLNSPLAGESDVVIPIRVTRECDPDNCQGTTSFAVTCAVFDALQTAVIELSGFCKDDFAVIHPGGAVGKRLNGVK
ncbi:MAG: SIS domain-containing protein [Clostridia bacterium]|nr:SIS domain-containing protein [Clostridia bacterium]